MATKKGRSSVDLGVDYHFSLGYVFHIWFKYRDNFNI